MFPIRRAALRLLSSSPSRLISSTSRLLSTRPSSLSLGSPRPITQFDLQRRWASDSAENRQEEALPVSKLQPTAEEEVENAIALDNAKVEDSPAEPAYAEGSTGEVDASAGESPVDAANDAVAANVAPLTETPTYGRSPRNAGPRYAVPLQRINPKETLYIGNLFFDVTEDDLKKELEEFGTIVKIRLIRDPRGLSKGFGYVQFENIDQATSCIKAMNQQLFEGRRVTVQYAAQDAPLVRPHPKGGSNEQNPPSKTLFIGNMSWEMTDRDLNNLFRGIKNVIDVRVAIDRRTGQPRGFAHADFIDVKSAMEAAKQLEGKETYGRKLKIDYSYGSSMAARNQARDQQQD